MSPPSKSNARNAPVTVPVGTPVKYPVFNFTWRHRTFKIYTERNGLLRARSRAGDFKFDFTLKTRKFKQARVEAKARLDSTFTGGFAYVAKPNLAKATRATLADAIAAYEAMPKGCAEASSKAYVNAATCIARQTWDKAPGEVYLIDFTALCAAYVSMKQADEIPNAAKRPDYNTRRSINRSITSMLRQARCLFIPELHNDYRARGIILPEGIENVRYPRELRKMQSDLDDKAMIEAWAALRDADPEMYGAVGLARFAGLRRKEVFACRGSWIVKSDEGVFIEVRDREDEGFRTKTDVETYHPQVIHPAFAAWLVSRKTTPKEKIIGNAGIVWQREGVQAWLRQFTDAEKPLHRLRAEYAMQIKLEHARAILADMEGTQAASKSLGHTNSRVTTKAYLNHKRLA